MARGPSEDERPGREVMGKPCASLALGGSVFRQACVGYRPSSTNRRMAAHSFA